MFTLHIYKADGSVYWTDYFNTRDALDKWLAEEMTRPYWNPEYTSEVVDNTPVVQPIDKEQTDDNT